ncbi:hypothetical protein J2R98_000570 [Alkalibacillus filiformis]|uniref:DUF4183 domain-containing protein n=1 Tax=Alkalibacillus filiformis TaxID=200990 RepID=A0ABU0DQP7_9BACI|nr:DUF4183 domain-containing protein [Alkalibacillus filiformis]MDQ0350767.1 hypothetical protein [Alkalibacillus filiformis]
MKKRSKKRQVISTKQVYDWQTTTIDLMVRLKVSKEPMKVKTYQYNTRSDGVRKVYTNSDELTEYGNRGVLNPNKFSIINLYINGVLQPPNIYNVEEGQLTLNTEDAPIEGAPITLQYIALYQ